jgi:regulator of protease activity HflC (stomatin/prohibitin superfamily)
MEQISIVLVGIVLLVVLYAILASFFTVRTAEVAVVTRFGKFQRVAEPGLNWKTPFLEHVAGPAREPDHSHDGDED